MIKKAIYFLILIVLSLSCYEQTIVINRGQLSGSITYNVEYHTDFENIISYLDETKTLDANTSILFDKNRLQKVVSGISGSRIIRQVIRNRSASRISNTTITFKDLKNLTNDLPIYYFTSKIYEENRTMFFNTSLSLSKFAEPKDIRLVYKQLNDEEKNIIDKYASILKLKFVFITPSPIIFANRGKVQSDKRTLIYETTVKELLETRKEFDINITFRK